LKPGVAYLVSITARAERDLTSIYERINVESSGAALKWYRGLKRQILSLEEHPNRCPITPEDKNLRHLLYGRKPNIYRVIYRVVEHHQRVDILHIRHGARHKLGAVAP
jgi:plasmid stabilization system protein ParE